MKEKISIYLPQEISREIKQEAKQLGVSISEVIRKVMEEYKILQEQLEMMSQGDQKSLMPWLVENNLFLRELAFVRDSRILDRVQGDMKDRFPKHKGPS